MTTMDSPSFCGKSFRTNNSRQPHLGHSVKYMIHHEVTKSTKHNWFASVSRVSEPSSLKKSNPPNSCRARRSKTSSCFSCLRGSPFFDSKRQPRCLHKIQRNDLADEDQHARDIENSRRRLRGS